MRPSESHTTTASLAEAIIARAERSDATSLSASTRSVRSVMVSADPDITPVSNGVAEIRKKRSLPRSEEHTSELQSLMRISYAVFCLKKNKKNTTITNKLH